MLRTTTFLAVFVASFVWAQDVPLTVTSAASETTNLTAGSLATVMGANLTTQTATAASTPWPTMLGNVTVQVADSGNAMRSAGLLFVSPTQINFQIPPGTALGIASVLINNGSKTFVAQVPVMPSAPALFAIDSTGIAAATAVRYVLPTQMQGPVTVFLCGDPGQGCHLTPIDPGVDAPVYLSFYGTGVGSGSAVVKIGSVTVDATYAGPQGQFPGLDQINVPLPLALHGAGTVDVTVTVNGVTSNAVKIAVQ
jgi:uncharacterized protein (TIGR03437 family)